MAHILRDGQQSRNGSLIPSGSSEKLAKGIWEPRRPEVDSNAQVTLVATGRFLTGLASRARGTGSGHRTARRGGSPGCSLADRL